MVEVSVRQNQRLNIIGGERKLLPVAVTPFFLPLKQPAIDQHLHSALS